MPTPHLTHHVPLAGLTDLLAQFLHAIVHERGYSPATAEAYERDVSRFIGFVAETRGRAVEADELTTADVYAWLGSDAQLSPATLRRRLYAVSSFLSSLADRGLIAANAAAGVEPPVPEPAPVRVPTRAESGRILRACRNPIEFMAIALLIFAGLRRAEMLGLTVDDVAGDLSEIRVHGKGGRERTVPVNSSLRAVLAGYLGWRRASAAALIVNADGQPMATTSFWRMFQQVLERAGLSDSGLTPHSLRHGFATELMRAGADIATIAELLGHANILTTSTYLHTSSTTAQAAVEDLDRAFWVDLRAGAGTADPGPA